MKKILLLLLLSFTGFAQNGYNVEFGQVYRLENTSNQKSIEVEDGLLSKGTRVQQYRGYTRNGSTDGYNQEWIFLPGEIIERNGQKIYLVRILNYGFLDYLTNNSGTVQLAKFNTNTANLGQFWEVIRTPNGNIKLRSHVSNTFLQAPNDANDGTAMTLAVRNDSPAQEFKPVTFVKDGVPRFAYSEAVAIKPANNAHLALDVTACGTAESTLLNVWNVGRNNVCQQFQFKRALGENQVHIKPMLKPDFGVRLQDITSKAAGANIVIGSQPTETSTVWIAVKVIREPNKYIFFNLISGLCMEVWNARTDAGATIGQNVFTNGNHQKWLIEKTN